MINHVHWQQTVLSDCVFNCQYIGVLDYAEGTGRDIIRAQTEKKLKETVSGPAREDRHSLLL